VLESRNIQIRLGGGRGVAANKKKNGGRSFVPRLKERGEVHLPPSQKCDKKKEGGKGANRRYLPAARRGEGKEKKTPQQLFPMQRRGEERQRGGKRGEDLRIHSLEEGGKSRMTILFRPNFQEEEQSLKRKRDEVDFLFSGKRRGGVGREALSAARKPERKKVKVNARKKGEKDPWYKSLFSDTEKRKKKKGEGAYRPIFSRGGKQRSKKKGKPRHR